MPSKIPKTLTKKLCRIIGIIHGDGNMSSSRIHISDKCLHYHLKELKPLFKDIFNIELNLYHDKNRNSYYSHFKNKKVYWYLTEKLKIPKGSVRKQLFVPNYLKMAKDYLKAAYISGIFDSESCISKRQAEINFSTTCESLFEFIKKFLNNKKIKFNPRIRDRRKNKEYEIYIYGKENIKKMLKIIKINHPEKILRLKYFSLIH